MGEVLRAGLHNRRAQLALLERRVLVITGRTSRCRLRGRGGRIIVDARDLALVVLQVLIIPVYVIQEVRRILDVAGHRRGIGLEDEATFRIILVKRVPLLRVSRRAALVDVEQDLPVAVAVHDILTHERGAVVGERFDGPIGPARRARRGC